MLYDPMNLPREEVTTEPVYFHAYEDFCYRVNGYLFVTVQEIDERQTAVLLCYNDRSHVAVIIAQSAMKVFEDIAPEEFVKMGGHFWRSELECRKVYRFGCVEEFMEFLY